jgi:hypothetical protein
LPAFIKLHNALFWRKRRLSRDVNDVEESLFLLNTSMLVKQASLIHDAERDKINKRKLKAAQIAQIEDYFCQIKSSFWDLDKFSKLGIRFCYKSMIAFLTDFAESRTLLPLSHVYSLAIRSFLYANLEEILS